MLQARPVQQRRGRSGGWVAPYGNCSLSSGWTGPDTSLNLTAKPANAGWHVTGRLRRQMGPLTPDTAPERRIWEGTEWS